MPRPFVQEEMPSLSNHVAHDAGMHDALSREEQRIEHVWVVLHAQVEVVDDIVDVQIILASPAAKSRSIVNVVFLVADELLFLTPEAVDLSCKMREYNVLGRDAPTNHVEVRIIDSGTVGGTSLNSLEHDVIREPGRRRDKMASGELRDYAGHGFFRMNVKTSPSHTASGHR